MTFQRAPPEVNGLGSITSTPSLTRSSQVLIPFGLPLRTAKTTTEFVTMPFHSSSAQGSASWPDSTSAIDVGRERERDDVGLQALLDGAALLARAAVRLVERRRPCLRPSSAKSFVSCA